MSQMQLIICECIIHITLCVPLFYIFICSITFLYGLKVTLIKAKDAIRINITTTEIQECVPLAIFNIREHCLSLFNFQSTTKMK